MKAGLRVWLLNASEQLAYSGSERRRMRTGLLARALLERGHQVVWWKSTFEHVSKEHYRNSDGFEEVETGLTVGWLHSRGYQGHVSAARVLDHAQVGAKFGIAARKRERPDVIVCSMPIPDLALAGAVYGRRRGVPVVVDIRDWWPEALTYGLSPVLRKAALGVLFPHSILVEHTCRKAKAITGITDEFVDWGLEKAGRERRRLDRAFPHGYEVPTIANEQREQAARYWNRAGIGSDEDSLVVTFIGSVTRSFDFGPIMDAAHKLASAGVEAKFVICGDGDRLEATRALARGLDNVVFTGQWVGPAQIRELLTRTSIGLVPLPDRPDFLATINNKTIEYLSAGVPIVVGPPASHVARLVERERCGVSLSFDSPVELTARIRALLEDRTRLDQLSERARALYDERYSAKRVYGAFARHVEEISESAMVR